MARGISQSQHGGLGSGSGKLAAAALAAAQRPMPYQRGQFWIRRFRRQAEYLCAALAALAVPPTATTFVIRALHILESIGWIASHRFLFADLRMQIDVAAFAIACAQKSGGGQIPSWFDCRGADAGHKKSASSAPLPSNACARPSSAGGLRSRVSPLPPRESQPKPRSAPRSAQKQSAPSESAPSFLM